MNFSQPSITELEEKYVIDAMDWRVEFGSGLERQEIPEIPVDAIREAVINAFAHRQLESGQSVEIAVSRSFIEIYSPGKFPEGVEPEQFIREIRKPIRRNPLITRTLYYSKDMESFATGLKRIYDACDAAECKVEFYGDDYGFTVRFYRHCGDGWNQALSASLEKRGTQSGTQDDSQAAASEKLIKLIRENSKATRKQMAETLSVSIRTIQRSKLIGIHLLRDCILSTCHSADNAVSGLAEILIYSGNAKLYVAEAACYSVLNALSRCIELLISETVIHLVDLIHPGVKAETVHHAPHSSAHHAAHAEATEAAPASAEDKNQENPRHEISAEAKASLRSCCNIPPSYLTPG